MKFFWRIVFIAKEINTQGVMPNDMAVGLRNVIAFWSRAISRVP